MIPLDAYNPLTPFWTAVTVSFEGGLALAFLILYLKVIPYLKARSGMFDFKEPKDVMVLFNSKLAHFAFRYILGVRRIRRIPVHPKWFIINLFLQGGFILIVLMVFLLLLTTKGWEYGFNLQAAYYDLIYARVNGQPNGAHISSYLTVPIFAFYVMWKYKDAYLGALAGGFLGVLHEGIWMAFYYAGYWQFLDWDLLTSIAKDISFTAAILLIVYTFRKYPFQRISLSAFRLPASGFTIFCAWWFIGLVPFGYGILPIALINNYKIGHGVYQMTQFWGDPVVNAVEVAGWLMIFALSMIVVARLKR